MEIGGIGLSAITFGAPLVVIVVLVVLLVAVRLGPLAHRRRRRHMAASWPSTPGTVLMSTIQLRRAGTNRHEVPMVVYSYTVGEQMYQSNRIRVGDDPRVAQAGSLSSAAHVVQRYPVGAMVQVFFDPADPSASALER